MKTRFRTDQILALLFIILGVYIFYDTYSFKAFVELNVPGPDAVPRAAAVMMIIFSIYIIIMSLLGQSPKPKPIMKAAIKPSILTVVFGGIFVILIPIVGIYVMAFILPILFHFFISDVKNKFSKGPLITVLIFSSGLSLFVYGVFHKLLNLPLPSGILF